LDSRCAHNDNESEDDAAANIGMRDGVLNVLTQAITYGKASELRRCLAGHFLEDASRVMINDRNLELHVRKVAQDRASASLQLPRNILCAHAVAPMEYVTAQGADEDNLRRRAVKDIMSAPMLVELGEWLQWSDHYATQLGSLGRFIQEHVVSKYENDSVAFLEISHGRYVRIAPLSVGQKDLQQAAIALDAVHAAAVAMSIVASVERQSSVPLALLRETLQRELKKVEGCLAAEFTAMALEVMPHMFRSQLGAKVCVPVGFVIVCERPCDLVCPHERESECVCE
jgi:hypothetical protein